MSGAAAIAHGGMLAAARRRWPDAPQPWIDLSTGINPIPYPVPPARSEDLHRLPEPEALVAVQSAAADAYGVDPDMVVAAPGTQILISLLPLFCPAPTVAVLGPTYAEHAASWVAAGARLTDVESAHSVVIVNPNNPDGRRYAPAELVDLAQRLGERGGHLVVDEAFVDLEGPGLSVAARLPCHGLIVLRSFGKTYGLAGLRLGFLLADPGLARRVRMSLGPWAVSGPALAVARIALADAAWRDAAALRLDRDTRRLEALLVAAGCRIIGGTRLFRLVGAPAEMHERLARAGILTRAFAEAPDRLRFGLPGDLQAWERLERALTRAG